MNTRFQISIQRSPAASGERPQPAYVTGRPVVHALAAQVECVERLGAHAVRLDPPLPPLLANALDADPEIRRAYLSVG